MRGCRVIGAIVAFASVTCFVAAGHAQTIIYVDADASETPHDGSDWCLAYLTLYEALDLPPSPGTTIRVANGTYAPDPTGLGDPRRATFQLINGVTIEGGYAGCGAPDPDEREINLHLTTLSGDLGTPGDDSDNSYHVVTGTGVTDTEHTVLDGFSIEAGNASHPSTWQQARGGGMYCDPGSPTVVNCTFSGNSASVYGGAMYIRNNSSPMVTGCTFVGNTAESGAGTYNAHSSPTIANCTFSGNSASTDGGGMYNHVSSPTVTDCTFSGNTAFDGGGGMFNDAGSTPTVANCILWGNTPDAIVGPAIVTYSDVEGGVTGDGNIDVDPLFADADGPDDIPGTEDDDLRLLPGSPCIDAGDNSAVPPDTADLDGDGDTAEPTPFDLDGNPRFVDDPATPDTGNGAPPIVDMGAYEFQGGGEQIPTVSEWGMVVLALLFLAGLTVVFRARRTATG